MDAARTLLDLLDVPGFHEVRFLEGATWRVAWEPADKLVPVLRRRGEIYGDVELSLAPRREKGRSEASRGRCLWLRAEGKRAERRLELFRPYPTMVLQDGALHRYLALWGLAEPLTHAWLVRANRRIAASAGMPAGQSCDPDSFLMRPPGSELRHGRAKAVPIRVRAVNGGGYRPAEVVGRLRDAPDPNGWRK